MMVYGSSSGLPASVRAIAIRSFLAGLVKEDLGEVAVRGAVDTGLAPNPHIQPSTTYVMTSDIE